MSARVHCQQELTWFENLCASSVFSVPLWCGLSSNIHHRYTEDTEVAQRRVLSIPSKLFAIPFEVALHLSQTVPTKLLAQRSSQHQRHHRLTDHTGSRHRGNVRTLKRRRLFLLRIDVH